MKDNVAILQKAVRKLASVCDGAVEDDGVGFNGTDSAFGRSLAGQNYWTPRQSQAAYKMVQKYREQLLRYGIDISRIDPPSEWPDIPEPQVHWENFSKLSFQWSEPKEVWKDGVKLLVQSSPVPTDFWSYWRQHKEAIKNLGMSVSKYNDHWSVAKWTVVETKAQEEKGESVRINDVQLKNKHLLLDYQPEHVRQLIAAMLNNGSAIDASDTGTGKTYASLAVAKELGLFPIVLTPKSVIPSFKKVMERHFQLEGFVSNYEQFKIGKTPYMDVDKEKGSFNWKVPENALVIFDEVHRCKNYKTQNSKMLVQAKSQNLRVIIMSATVASNPLHMFATGYLLGLFKDTQGFFRWVHAHGCRRGEWGGFAFNNNPKYLLNINKQIFPFRGGRVSIKDLGDKFPDTLIISEAYKMDNSEKIQAAYQEVKRAIDGLRKKREGDSDHHLVELLRARQQIEYLKVPTLAEMAQDHIEENNSVAVFVNFNESVAELASKLKTDCIVWGSQKAEEREANIRAFQENKSPVIICNIRAGGVGISLHDELKQRQRVSLISPSWSGEDMKQALGRVHRAGGTKSIQKIVFCAGTIEEGVCETVAEKIRNMGIINDGDLSPKVF